MLCMKASRAKARPTLRVLLYWSGLSPICTPLELKLYSFRSNKLNNSIIINMVKKSYFRYKYNINLDIAFSA